MNAINAVLTSMGLPGNPGTSEEEPVLALLEMRPVIDANVVEKSDDYKRSNPRAQLRDILALRRMRPTFDPEDQPKPRLALDPWPRPQRGPALQACSLRLAGKIANEAEFLRGNWFNGDLPPRHGLRFAVANGRELGLTNQYTVHAARELCASPIFLPTAGEVRYSMISRNGDYLFKSAHTLPVPVNLRTEFLSGLDRLIQGAHVLCASGVSEKSDMDLIDEVAKRAKAFGTHLIVDACDGPLVHYFTQAARDDGTKLAAAKPNLEEFCLLVRQLGLIPENDPQITSEFLETLLENGNTGKFRRLVVALAQELADTCFAPHTGQLILSLGAHGFMVFTAKEKPVWDVLPIPIQPRSTVGSGDSLLAMYALFRLYDIPLGSQQFQLMAAAGAATAQQPWSQMGSLSCILELAKRHENVATVG